MHHINHHLNNSIVDGTFYHRHLGSGNGGPGGGSNTTNSGGINRSPDVLDNYDETNHHHQHSQDYNIKSNNNNNNNTTTNNNNINNNNESNLTLDNKNYINNNNNHIEHNNLNINNNNNNSNSLVHSIKNRLLDTYTVNNVSPRFSSESPELQTTTTNIKRKYENNSPVESSISYPFSQKSSGEELEGNSPPPDSIESHSSENRLIQNDNNNQLTGSGKLFSSDMLDHKLPLSFLGPPLAALHSMTEMKSHQNSQNTCNGNNNTTSLANGNSNINNNNNNNNNSSSNNNNNNNTNNNNSSNNNNLGLGQTSQNSHITANPHGIDTILSKPPPVTTSQLNALAGNMPRFSIAAAAAGMAQYLSQNQGAGIKTHSGHIVDRPHLYWPGLQGLVSNPMAWRDRLTNSLSANLSQSHHHNSDKDGKKKHTRPTFSGQQIFALEKTFEQTKYLAGPERAKLAYALGMTESQVKVWFQNRRTKWRKKHAAEMATAKRKQEELGDPDGDCSETMDSDSESMDSNRKRYKMDDDYRQ